MRIRVLIVVLAISGAIGWGRGEERFLLSHFEVRGNRVLTEEEVKNIKEDDIELMKFGFRWLEFALFGKKSMTFKDDAEKERKE